MLPTKGASRATGLALGYLLVPDGVDSEVTTAEAVEALTGYARRHGYAVAGMFTDVAGRTDHGFYALLGALRIGRAGLVVVASLDHLTHHACLDGADERTVTRYLRARILRVDRADANPLAEQQPQQLDHTRTWVPGLSSPSPWGITDEQDRHGRGSRADGRGRAQPSPVPGEGRRHRSP